MIKRILLLLVFLCFALPAHAATISVQSATLSGFNGSATATYQLWVFSDSPWTDVSGNPHGAGSPSDKVFTQIVTGLSFNNPTKVLTIPAFNLTSTTDAVVNPNVRLYVWIFQVVGVSATPIKPYPNTENGIKVPAAIASASACSPAGTCATFYDLIAYSQSAPPPPLPRFTYSDSQIDAKFAAAAVGASFAPKDATYITQTTNTTLSAEQALSALATGLLKNTTTTGVLSIAGASDLPSGIDATKIGAGAVSNTEFGYLDGAASAIQPQIDGKQASLGFTPENVANKSIDGTLASNSDTLYASQKATKTYADTKVSSVSATSPITTTGGTTPMIACATCVIASSPGAGVAHFPGSTQTVTSSSIVNADIANGTIDLTAKVTGVLPVANGGTGSATQNFVDLTTTQSSIAGAKTFTNNLTAPIYNKGGEVYDVVAYGADPSGAADSLSAFDAARDAAKNASRGIVYIPAGNYYLSTQWDIGDGTSTTVSTYHGIRVVGAGSNRLNATATNHAVRLFRGGATTTPVIRVRGPIGGVTIEGVLIDCANTATKGIEITHAEGTTLRNVQIIQPTSIALDVDAYDTSTFGANTVFNSGNTGYVENLFINSTNNNTTGVRLAATGNIAQWTFIGGRWRLDGTTGSNVLVLSFADHNVFWGVTGKAETGIRFKAITGHTSFPMNNSTWASSFQATSGANAYVIDNSVATWAPSSGYGNPLLMMPTADGSVAPTDTRLWGFTDTQIFLGTWRFRDALTASSTLLVSGILSAGSGPTTLTNATGQLLAAAAASPTGSGNWVLATSPTITTPNIVGTATNNNASAGSVGEYVEGTAAIGSVSLTSITAKTITSISLTAGDWDVSVIGYFSPDGTTKVREVAVSLSSVNNTLNITPGRFTDDHKQDLTYSTAISHAIPKYRFSLSGTTTVYLVMYADFNTSTMTAGGYISARRVR
jgi:hypothetical protein